MSRERERDVVDAKPEGALEIHMPTDGYVIGKHGSRIRRDISWRNMVEVLRKSRAGSEPESEVDS